MLTRSPEQTAGPLRSTAVAGFGNALWWQGIAGAIAVERLTLSSVVRWPAPALSNELEITSTQDLRRASGE